MSHSRKEDLMMIKVVDHFQVIREGKELIRMWLFSLEPTGGGNGYKHHKDRIDDCLWNLG